VVLVVSEGFGFGVGVFVELVAEGAIGVVGEE